jgi:hypothetical protein
MRVAAYCAGRDPIASSSCPHLSNVAEQGETPMIPSRREFVASIATMPFLPQALERRPAGAPDPVLDQILADLRELSAELESQPRSRKATMRAMESAMSVGAAHLAAHYDADFQSALRRRMAKTGRTVLVQDIVTQAHDRNNHDVSYDAVDAAITRLQSRGLSGSFRDVQEATRRVRLQAPEQIQAAAFPAVQWDYCSDLNWMISIMEAVTAIACGIAILEPTPGGEIACGAMTLALGLLLLERAFFC